jgi:hypothetical protein
MHNCPSCEKKTANIVVLTFGFKPDICDECMLVAMLICSPSDEELMFEAIDELVQNEQLVMS